MASNGPNRIQAFANDAIVYFSRHDNLLLRHLIGGKPVETKWVFVQSSPVLCSGSIVMAPLSSILTTICGLNELGRHTTRGITHVLSIMDPDSPEPRIFETFQPHRRTTLRFHDEIDPGPNLILPQMQHLHTILAFGRSLAIEAAEQGGPHVLAHCHMGISRSTAAMVALLAVFHPGEDEDKIFARLVEMRPEAWPNSRMIKLTDDLLGRRGCLTAALGRLYAAQLINRSEMGPYLRKHGRGREVDMANSQTFE